MFGLVALSRRAHKNEGQSTNVTLGPPPPSRQLLSHVKQLKSILEYEEKYEERGLLIVKNDY